jgi:hypothetical protein
LPAGSVTVRVPQVPRDREPAASLLDEAGYWTGGVSRPTLRDVAVRRRGRSQCA